MSPIDSCPWLGTIDVYSLWEINAGPLAHLVEHLICNEGVAGSNPVRSTRAGMCSDYKARTSANSLSVSSGKWISSGMSMGISVGRIIDL